MWKVNIMRGTKRQDPRERRGSSHHIQTHSEITLSAAEAGVRKYEIDVCIPLVGSIVVACPPLPAISSGREGPQVESAIVRTPLVAIFSPAVRDPSFT